MTDHLFHRSWPSRTTSVLIFGGLFLILANIVLRVDVLYQTGTDNPRIVLVLIGALYTTIGIGHWLIEEVDVSRSFAVAIGSIVAVSGFGVGLVVVGLEFANVGDPQLALVEYFRWRLVQVVEVAPVAIAYPLGMVTRLTGERRYVYQNVIFGVTLVAWLLAMVPVFGVGGFAVLGYLVYFFYNFVFGVPLYLLIVYEETIDRTGSPI